MCDEDHPECGACRRHQVTCQYLTQPTRSTGRLERSEFPVSAVSQVTHYSPEPQMETSLQANEPRDSTLELALLHYFFTETISAFHDPIAVWKTRIPLVGLRHRFVLDGLLSLAALDLYRHTYETYKPHENAETSLDAGQNFHIDWYAVTNRRHHYLVGHKPEEMLHLSLAYFDTAIAGQKSVLEHPDKRRFEPAFMASLAIMTYALWSLACPPDNGHDHSYGHGQNLVTYDERLWFSLGRGCREIVRSWCQSAGMNVLQSAGYYEMRPNYSKEEELFHCKHRDVFHALLIWGMEFETTTTEEYEAYEKAFSFLGLLYKGVRDNSEPACVSGSLIASFPAKVPPPFQKLVLERRPRALVIVGYLFAIMRLLEAQIPHYRGIAARQIPEICERLPKAWKRAIQWASTIASRDINCLDPLPQPPSLEDLRQSRNLD